MWKQMRSVAISAQSLSTQILPAARTQNESVTTALPSPQYVAGPASFPPPQSDSALSAQPAPPASVSSGVKLPGNSTLPAFGEPGSAAFGTPGNSGEKTSASKGQVSIKVCKFMEAYSSEGGKWEEDFAGGVICR